MTLYRLIFLLTLACLLLACGQRGPLYLPEETAAPAASEAAPDKPANGLENENVSNAEGSGAKVDDDGVDDEP